MSKPFYITTTLPYVNADPHIGFALEIIQADIIARYERSSGREVFFNTGTDEHGQKIFEAAKKDGRNVKDYTDHYATEFKKLKDLLNLSNDTFVRTTDLNHEKVATELWRRCLANGDIELRDYEGLYCVGCELYKSKRDLNGEGRCSLHPNQELITLHENNYFFLFKKYEKKLLDYLNRPDSIVPEWKRQEAINFVKEGLEDFSISRQRGQLEWGIPVPDDPDQVMYVWFDALANYISTLGWPDETGNFKKFWNDGEVVQCAGKDQVRFQSLMWQAMLMSANIKNTDTVFYHGFVNSNGQKMSKSLGNVVSPEEIIAEYGVDAFRYFVARELATFDDSDFTRERFKEAYNAGLANGLGNLVSRIMTLSEKYTESSGVAETIVNDEKVKGLSPFIKDALDSFNINLACQMIWNHISELDKIISDEEVFKVVKSDLSGARKMLENYLSKLAIIAFELESILPETSKKIIETMKLNKKPEQPLFARKD